jgi:ESCRT-II complex subunit VPS22
MRKGAGISALSRHTANTSSYAALSSTISSNQLVSLQSSLSSFKDALQQFAQEHRGDIRRDPAFRHQFQKMCAAIGVDPLSGDRSKGTSSKAGLGWWSEILGVGEWEYEVAVQVVDVCVSTRDRNGGMIDVNELVRRVEKLRGIKPTASTTTNGQQAIGSVTREDVLRAIDLLRPLYAGYTIHPIGAQIYVRSVPRELDTDQSTLLVLAVSTNGKLSVNSIKRDTGWSDVRANTALDDTVMREGLGWVDEQTESGEREVWMISAVDFGSDGL